MLKQILIIPNQKNKTLCWWISVFATAAFSLSGRQTVVVVTSLHWQKQSLTGADHLRSKWAVGWHPWSKGHWQSCFPLKSTQVLWLMKKSVVCLVLLLIWGHIYIIIEAIGTRWFLRPKTRAVFLTLLQEILRSWTADLVQGPDLLWKQRNASDEKI